MEIFCVLSIAVFEVSLLLVAFARCLALFARFSNIGPLQVHAWYSSIDYTIETASSGQPFALKFRAQSKSRTFLLGIHEKDVFDRLHPESRLIDYKVADVCLRTHVHTFPATVTAPNTMCEADQHKQQQNVNIVGHPLQSKTMERAWLYHDVIINKRKYTHTHTHTHIQAQNFKHLISVRASNYFGIAENQYKDKSTRTQRIGSKHTST